MSLTDTCDNYQHVIQKYYSTTFKNTAMLKHFEAK